MGGGAYVDGGLARIRNCRFEENAAGGTAGMYLAADGVFQNLVFRRNVAEFGGGGLATGSNVQAVHNLILVDNRAAEGGGLVIGSSWVSVVNSCIVGNTASNYGGGVAVGSANADLTNSVIWDNFAPVGRSIGFFEGSEGRLRVQFSNVEGGEAEVLVRSNTELTWDKSNLEIVPEFAFPRDFHLMPGAALIDRGTDAPPQGLSVKDADGGPRIIDGDGSGVASPDLSPYEHNPETPTLAIDQDTLSFQTFADDGDPPPQQLLVRNCGAGLLSWRVESDATWMTTTPSEGEVDAEPVQIGVHAAIAGLTPGRHDAVLRFVAKGATNSERTVRIALLINQRIRVPQDYATIQAALDATTGDGDEVVLAPGVYKGPGNRELTFRGRPRSLIGSADPAEVVLDCEGQTRGVQFLAEEPPETRVWGITFTGGFGKPGGAMYGENCAPTIENCIFEKNKADRTGGAMSFYQSNPTIRDCIFRQNEAIDTGAVNFHDGRPVRMERCLFVDNSGEDGALELTGNDGTFVELEIRGENSAVPSRGLLIQNGKPTFERCLIKGNRASTGAGVLLSATNARFVACTFASNGNEDRSVSGLGVASINNGSPVFENCAFVENVSTHTSSIGGGLKLIGGAPRLLNCLIASNTANNAGGVDLDDSDATFTNCTFARNKATQNGGGVYARYASKVSVNSCVLWGNTARNGRQLAVEGSTTVLKVDYCDSEGGESRVYKGDGGTLEWGAGNLNADPKFIDAAKGNYHIADDSPVIDAGDSRRQGYLELDLDAEPRLMGGIVDMGVDEHTARAYLLGDMNCDGLRDLDDIDGFVSALIGPSDYAQQFPDCVLDNGDCNRDGVMDFDDIDRFVELLTQG